MQAWKFVEEERNDRVAVQEVGGGGGEEIAAAVPPLGCFCAAAWSEKKTNFEGERKRDWTTKNGPSRKQY